MCSREVEQHLLEILVREEGPRGSSLQSAPYGLPVLPQDLASSCMRRELTFRNQRPYPVPWQNVDMPLWWLLTRSKQCQVCCISECCALGKRAKATLTHVQSQTAGDPGLQGGGEVRSHCQTRIADRLGAAGAMTHDAILQASVSATRLHAQATRPHV